VPDKFADLRHELAVANRILAHEGVIDAFGHVSIRHPDDAGRYFLSRSRSPELVEPDDILEFDLDSQPVTPPSVQIYSERVIHGEIYRARPDVIAVCHHHAAAIMPFCISGDPIVPVFHLGAAMGAVAPFWDSRLARPRARQARHGADATPWRNGDRRQPARTGFPLDLFLRQCPLPQ
jgi:HCOMODA/2-hydroxy-3-carboxy-muconic semialdehyde decarboxylase